MAGERLRREPAPDVVVVVPDAPPVLDEGAARVLLRILLKARDNHT